MIGIVIGGFDESEFCDASNDSDKLSDTCGKDKYLSKKRWTILFSFCMKN